jgi:hypothetical protein
MLPTSRMSQFSRLLGTETTINQLLLRTYVDDADPFVHLIYQLYTHTPSLSIYNHADVLLLKPTSHPAWFPGLIGTKMTINQLLLSTDVVQPF